MRRVSALLTAAVALLLLGASWWCVRAAGEVSRLREEVDIRVDQLEDIHAIVGAIESSRRPDEVAAMSLRIDELARRVAEQRAPGDAVVERMREAVRRSGELKTIAQQAHADVRPSHDAIELELDAVVPILRSEIVERATVVRARGSAINRIIALTVALAAVTTGLLGYLLCFAMPRMWQANARLHQLAHKIATAPSAAGISHGVGGPMTVATTSLQLLRERLDDGPADEEAMRLLDDALHALARATGTLQDLRGGSGPDIEPPPPRVETTTPSKLRILLVDDDEMVAVSTKRVLAHHDVETATDGTRGMERALSGSFDLVLCDLMMPGKSGIDVYRALERTRPELLQRFVFMSGGANDEAAAAFLDDYRGPRLDKPFGMKELRELVARYQPL